MDCLVKGDTGSAVRITCLDNITSSPINLNGSIVKLQWRHNGTIFNQTMEIIDPIKGIVQYMFESNELYTPEMSFDVVIINNLTNKQVTCKDILKVLVRDRV